MRTSGASAQGSEMSSRSTNEGSGGSKRSVVCLLYTSDAADERSSVDLGGRRIIKKKKHDSNRVGAREEENTHGR